MTPTENERLIQVREIAAAAIVNEKRRFHGFPPILWSDLKEHEQRDELRLADAVLAALTRPDSGDAGVVEREAVVAWLRRAAEGHRLAGGSLKRHASDHGADVDAALLAYALDAVLRYEAAAVAIEAGDHLSTPAHFAGTAVEALAWFGGQHALELTFYMPVYSDDEDQAREWRVHRVSGGINDREWTMLGAGETPLAAMLAARSKGDDQ